MEHVLHVLVLLKFFKELVEGFALLVGNLLNVVGDADEFCRQDFKAVAFEILLDVRIFLERTVEHDCILVGLKFIHAVVDEFKFEILEAHVGFGLNLEHHLVVEKECEGALGAQRAAVLCEIGAHVGHGAGVVVGSGLHEDGDTEGSVSLVGDLLVVLGILVGGFLDGAFHSVLGHVLSLGILHERTQAGVGGGIGAAGLHGDGDFLTDACECAAHVAPAFQFSGFAIFKCASHIECTFLFCFVMFCSDYSDRGEGGQRSSAPSFLRRLATMRSMAESICLS